MKKMLSLILLATVCGTSVNAEEPPLGIRESAARVLFWNTVNDIERRELAQSEHSEAQVNVLDEYVHDHPNDQFMRHWNDLQQDNKVRIFEELRQFYIDVYGQEGYNRWMVLPPVDALRIGLDRFRDLQRSLELINHALKRAMEDDEE